MMKCRSYVYEAMLQVKKINAYTNKRRRTNIAPFVIMMEPNMLSLSDPTVASLHWALSFTIQCNAIIIIQPYQARLNIFK